MDPDAVVDISERNRVRRAMAQGSMILIFTITIAFLWGLSSDAIAARVEKIWAPFAVIFPALIAQVIHYVQVGSSENKEQIRADQVTR